MREPTATRDQREIVVPGDMRTVRGAPGAAPRRPRARRPHGAGEVSANLRAAVLGAGRTCVANPGGTAGAVLALGAAAYVCLNAVGFQVGRHPAPILPSSTVAARTPARSPEPAARPAPRDVVREPVRETATAEAGRPEAARPESARPESARPESARIDAKPVPEVKPEAKPAPRDAIAEMIRAGGGETTASVSPKGERDVVRAQRALTKLGYGPLQDDGLMGPGTRAAIERFERDRKLPVKGEAAGRTLRDLLAKAGLPG